jgi:hypothetical protein
MFDLRAEVAIVTGGNGGISLGMARCSCGSRDDQPRGTVNGCVLESPPSTAIACPLT